MESKDTNVRKTLEISNPERDLGIRITNNLKWNQKVKIAANKANNLLGMLKRTFNYWTAETTKIFLGLESL